MLFRIHTCAGLGSAIILAGLIFTPLSVSAAQFGELDSSGNITFDDPTQENIYGVASHIEVQNRVLSDAVLVGEAIEFSEETDVTGGIIAFGQNLTLTPRTVGSSIRAAGQDITVSGYVRKDVVVAGETVVLEDIRVGGDLVIAAETIYVKDNVLIQGGIYATAAIVEGELTNSSGDNINLEVGQNAHSNQDFLPELTSVEFLFWLYSIIGSAIAVALLAYWLSRKNKLTVSAYAFNRTMFTDVITGALVFFVTAPVFVIALILSVGWPLLPVAFILYSLFALTGVYLPIYIANIIKNTASISMAIKWLIAIVFTASLLLSVIPFVKFVWWVISFILSLAILGSILRGLYIAIFAIFDAPDK